MLEQIILGAIQGIAEWLPISSEGVLVLVKTNFFGHGNSVHELIHQALLLHLGTFFAALIYFRKDVMMLMRAIFKYRDASEDTKQILKFLIVSTTISGILGILLLGLLSAVAQVIAPGGKAITISIGILLFITAMLEIRATDPGYRDFKKITFMDGVLLGVVQGFAVLPGFSRSGLTVSTLLLRKYDKTVALKLSFLMSLPIVFFGNLILNHNALAVSPEDILGLIISFAFGMATIHILFTISKKIHFGYFVLLFSVITLLSALF